MICFHGTSYQNARRIVKNGYNPKRKNWLVSEPNYFYGFNCLSPKEGIQRALIQAGNPAFCEEVCRRAVIAVELPETELLYDEYTKQEYTFKCKHSFITKENIKGLWWDKHDLAPIRYFGMARLAENALSGVKLPKHVEPFKVYFDLIPDQEVKVPIKQVFCSISIDFDPKTEKFKL